MLESESELESRLLIFSGIKSGIGIKNFTAVHGNPVEYTLEKAETYCFLQKNILVNFTAKQKEKEKEKEKEEQDKLANGDTKPNVNSIEGTNVKYNTIGATPQSHARDKLGSPPATNTLPSRINQDVKVIRMPGMTWKQAGTVNQLCDFKTNF